MSTLTLLERAHTYLTEMRDGSTPGTWEAHGDPGAGAWTVDSENFESVADHFGNRPEQDCELIVALHRTIDAQLEVLANAKWELGDPAWMHAGNQEQVEAALDLARAILGEPADG